MGSTQSRCASPASRLPVPIGELATASAVHEPGSPTVADSGAPPEHQGCGQLATLPRQTGRVSSYSHVFVCGHPVPHGTHVMPCRTSWTLRSTAAGTLRGRSGRVAHARSSQRRRARAVRSAGGQSVTIDSAILTTSSHSKKGASMPAASAGVIPPSSSCGRKRL